MELALPRFIRSAKTFDRPVSRAGRFNQLPTRSIKGVDELKGSVTIKSHSLLSPPPFIPFIHA